MDTQKLNIALRFDDEYLQEIADSVAEFKDAFETRYIVDNVESIPHLTLYQTLFPKKNVDEIIQALGDIAGNTTRFDLKFKTIKNNRSSIWAIFDKPAELTNLHMKVLEHVNPLREELVEEQFATDHPVYQSLTVTPKKMVEKWGHPFVDQMFDSHISLMKLVDRELVYAVINRLDWRIRELPVSKIALYECGEEGTCKELIKEFELA